MKKEELDAIRSRCQAATPGSWEWRAGIHTQDIRTSDAGGIHTQHPVTKWLPDGRSFEDDNVVFPVGVISGDPVWVRKFKKKADGIGQAPLSLALDLRAGLEDQSFIINARDDIPNLIKELDRLRTWLERIAEDKAMSGDEARATARKALAE